MTLVPLDTRAVCPDCAGLIIVHRTDEPALIRHGGYGATRSTVTRWCSECGWHVVFAIGEVRP